MTTEVIIPENQVFEDDAISKPKDDDFSINELNTKSTSIKQDDLDTPPSPGSLNPPPPYSQCSQWDELSIEQLLEKSREVLNAEYLANGGKKEKDGVVLDKMTQLETLVSSLQAILNDQTFAMHDLRSQLSDIQVVLKKMQDKQETISSEEIMKQVVTMKALTDNIIASSEIKKQLDTAKQQQLEIPSENDKNGKILQQLSIEEHQISPPVSILPPINTIPRTVSRQQFSSSRSPSRNPSRPSSRKSSRTVSPAHTPVSLSRTSSKNKLDSSNESPLIKPYKSNEFPTINEKSEEGGDEDDNEEDTSLDRMIRNINSLLTEATEAVELPIKGREKERTFSIISTSSIDVDDILGQIDEMSGDDDELDDEEEFVESPIEIGGLRPEDAESKWPRKHKRTKSDANKEDFLKSLNSFNDSMTGLENLIEDLGLTSEPQDEVCAPDGIHYPNSTNDLLKNPSSDIPDLDDFAQQCRLLTRALILPFLHATHSFMSESLQTTTIQTPKSVTSTTRTFMNLMYWTFLFTLGSLVLDAWLCEVAGRQVIRMVELLKPGQPFGIIANGYGGYGTTIDMDQQDGGIGMLEDGKKKKRQISYGA